MSRNCLECTREATFAGLEDTKRHDVVAFLSMAGCLYLPTMLGHRIYGNSQPLRKRTAVLPWSRQVGMQASTLFTLTYHSV